MSGDRLPPDRPMIDWPGVTELDVTLAPPASGSSKSQLAIAADPPSRLLGHFRYGLPKSAMRVFPLSPVESEQAEVIEEPVIYGGPLFRHFGHALSESIHRLWPRYGVRQLRNAKVAFMPVNLTKAMPYVTEALNLYGIRGGQIIRVTRPIRFRRLFVGKQARQMAGPTVIRNYRFMLDDSLARRLGPPGGDRRVYFSRLQHQHTGSFYGESFIEAALAGERFEIVYPERHSLTELVSMLRASEIAVFAEGSAIHALELCGSATPKVFVIGRRPNSCDRFKPLLSDICREWMVSDHLLLNAGMSEDPKKHSGLIDVGAVLEELSAFAGFQRKGRVSRAALADAIEHDVSRHIEDGRNEGSADYETRAKELNALVRCYSTAPLRRAAFGVRGWWRRCCKMSIDAVSRPAYRRVPDHDLHQKKDLP